MNYWHQSGIEDMTDCPERYRRGHEARERGEEYNTAAAMMGDAVHGAVAANLTQLRDLGVFETAGIVGLQAQAIFHDLVVWDQEKSADPVPFTGESFNERAAELDTMAIALWERMPSILETYGGPLDIERKFSDVPITSDLGVAGTWDLLTDRHWLIDWKTSRSGWRPGEELKKVQPIVYTMAAEHVTGRRPVGFAYVIVSRTGKVSVREVPVPPSRDTYLLEQVPRLERMRRLGIYPMNPGSLLCSDVWCPWFTRGCPAGRLKGAA